MKSLYVKSDGYHIYLEGDISPVELAWCSYMTEKEYQQVDEQRMFRLYEKFILEYYSYHFRGLSVNASQIFWSLDDGFGTMLSIMQSDIHLQKGNTILIIDAKYYAHTTQIV